MYINFCVLLRKHQLYLCNYYICTLTGCTITSNQVTPNQNIMVLSYTNYRTINKMLIVYCGEQGTSRSHSGLHGLLEPSEPGRQPLPPSNLDPNPGPPFGRIRSKTFSFKALCNKICPSPPTRFLHPPPNLDPNPRPPFGRIRSKTFFSKVLCNKICLPHQIFTPSYVSVQQRLREHGCLSRRGSRHKKAKVKMFKKLKMSKESISGRV